MMDEKSNRPACPSDAERDLALLRDCNNDIEMFRQRKCEQEIVSLCRTYGAGMVRHVLAKVTTGRPKKDLERFSKIWLAVELIPLL
jgi:hypothetical protein